jgi:hypothetical protein
MIEDMAPLRVIAVGPGEQSAAIKFLRRYSDQDLTLADGVGLHLMNEQKTKQCWSTDFHMRLTGVPLVIDGG